MKIQKTLSERARENTEYSMKASNIFDNIIKNKGYKKSPEYLEYLTFKNGVYQEHKALINEHKALMKEAKEKRKEVKEQLKGK